MGDQSKPRAKKVGSPAAPKPSLWSRLTRKKVHSSTPSSPSQSDPCAPSLSVYPDVPNYVIQHLNSMNGGHQPTFRPTNPTIQLLDRLDGISVVRKDSSAVHSPSSDFQSVVPNYVYEYLHRPPSHQQSAQPAAYQTFGAVNNNRPVAGTVHPIYHPTAQPQRWHPEPTSYAYPTQ